jgi:glyoxylate/hydroxypyruvate reductase A
MAIAFISEWDDSLRWRQAIEQHLGATDWCDDWHNGPAPGRLAEIDVALAWAPPAGLLASLPNLRLIVSLGMGVDHLLKDATLPAGLPIARINDPQIVEQMVEYAVLASLRVLRQSDRYDALQRAGQWHRLALREARDLRVGVMGLGAIGARVAAAHRALGFTVAGWARRPRHIEGVACFDGAAGLAPFLTRSELLICLLPLTADTRAILNARTLALLPRGAHVVNMARGGHVVETDLLAALEGGQLAGATLDVFETEPLPADHPFWRHSRVRLTPHVAGQTNPRTAAPGVADNIRRLRAGQPLHDLVDRAAGY